MQKVSIDSHTARDAHRTKHLAFPALRVWTPVVLVVVLLVGGYLRFTNLNWDEGKWIHPDEAHMRIILSAIEMPDDPSLYFDTDRSPLNCRNKEHRYSYGTLPLFLTRLTVEWIDQGCAESAGMLSKAAASLFLDDSEEPCMPGTFTGARSAQVGRALSGLADLGTIVLVFLIARRLYGELAGLIAASLMALTAFSIQQAHFFTVDSMACFFIALTAYFSVRAGQMGRWLDFGLAGLATGLAAACKVSAAYAAFLVVLAALWRWSYVTDRRAAVSLVGRLILAGLLSLVAFRVAQPYAFEGPGFLGLRPSPEWFERLGQIRAEQSGEADLPSGRQWTDRTPILFPWVNMTIWGMGIPLSLAAWIGWAIMGVELLRRGNQAKQAHLIVWIWATGMFVYQGVGWVKAMRYFLPLYPFFVIMAAYLLTRLCRAFSPGWRRFGLGFAAFVLVGAASWSWAVSSIYLRQHTRLAASRWIYANIPQGTTLATEHWDWAPPLPLDGYDPYGQLYTGFEMQLYDEDTWEKRSQLFDWLDQADYIIVASNRLYASISRLPARYPLTIAYYRALFAGELGFELAADFTSYPAIGPFQFPDQEEPFPLMAADYVYQHEPIEVRLPPAEEAFSVYDHPRVLIFHKTVDYARWRVEEVLGDIDVTRALHGQTPLQATQAPNMLKFDPETWADQQAGGTWSEMFNRDSLFNRYPVLAVLAWWMVVTGLGWLAFPLLFVALPGLRDRGYGLARVLGLLLVAYLTWLAASLRLLPNTRGTILRMTVLLALVGGGVGYFKRDSLRRFLRRRRRLILVIEALFAVLYLFWLGVRLLHPDLWHPIVGGEKPMDFAYLNAVMKSTWFPPYNPWFSGHYINYYYFGFVVVGTLIKLVGTVPTVAYNLAVPLLFALSGVGAFSVAYNLFGGHRRGAFLSGVGTLAFTVLLGNLGVVHLVRESLAKLGGEPFPSTIPGFPKTVAMLRGLWQVIAHDAKLPLRIESWYWHPTRMIPTETGNPIAEFPAFTFLYGDLHAHMIALPLTLLALVLIVYWWRASRPRWSSLILGGLVIGALWPTNTWDYPTYLALGGIGLLAGVWWHRSHDLRSRLMRIAFLVALSVLFYLPYIQCYAAGYTSVERWEGGNTPLNIYLWIHTILLFPVLMRLLIEVRRSAAWIKRMGRAAGRRPLRAGHWLLTVVSLVLTLFLYAMGYEVALVAVPVGVCAAYVLVMPWMPVTRRLLWFMVGTAMSLTLAVEIVVLKGDIGRQNTVFKFYMQVWILLSVAAGVSLAWMRERTRLWRLECRELWWIGMVVLIAGGALFLPYGIRARAVDRMAPETGRTLDGMAFMRYSTVFDGDPARGGREIPLAGDYAAIRWIQDNVQGSPVILEGLGHREYLWGNRVSIYTGLPTVIGWRWHEVQQYTVLPGHLVDWRREDVRRCYETLDTGSALEILARYGVRYVYVGAYERAYYDPFGLDKFEAMAAEGYLRVVYNDLGVKIYEVRADAFPADLEQLPEHGGEPQ